MKVTFLGAGSWGTALSVTVAKNGHDVTLWSAVEAELKLLREKREHTERLPGVKLPDNIMKVLVDEINDVYGWEAEKKEESNKSQKDKLNDLFLTRG